MIFQRKKDFQLSQKHAIGHEIRLRIFSKIVVFAHRKWWVVGGSESNACRLARSPLIGRERQIYPGAVRPSQRSAKYWLRAQNRSKKKYGNDKIYQLMIKASFRHVGKNSKIRHTYNRKMILPPFFIIFSRLFTQSVTQT